MEKEKFLAFRGFFLFNEKGDMCYSQRFATVEMQVPKNSSKLPSNDKLTNFFKDNILGVNKIDVRCVFHYESDTYLCILPTKYFYISVIPLIHKDSKQFNIDIVGALYFLSFIESVLRSNLRTLMPNSPFIDFLPIKQILNTILPFGSPVIHDQYFVSQVTSKTELSRFYAGYKNLENSLIPSWKTALIFPCQQFDIQLKECLIGSISPSRRYYKAFGEFIVTASLSYLPDVNLSFTKPETMKYIQSHFSVKSFKNGILTFTPPTGVSQILTWEIPVSADFMPIYCVYGYTLSEQKTIEYTIKTKVNTKINQATLHLPFYDCGVISDHKFKTVIGQLKQSKTETTISWDLPTSEGSETEISGSITFQENIPTQEFKALISIKGANRTFTGNTILKDNIKIDTQSNVSISISQSYSTDGKRYAIFGTQV